ncbi:MAG: excinuclease ABC subunit C, partial [Spirochaetes bacterium]|nr:excinuclease ABC subunit C [Spirochaetota bacterium]
KKYKKKNLESRLLKIKGLGKKRLNTIFIKFGSINSLISSSVNEIAMTEGIGENLAKKIFLYLH